MRLENGNKDMGFIIWGKSGSRIVFSQGQYSVEIVLALIYADFSAVIPFLD